MTLRPGRNLLQLMIVVGVASLAAFVWPPIAIVLALVMVFAAVGAEVDRRQILRQLKAAAVSRIAPAVVGRDAPFKLSVEVTNSDGAPLRGELRDCAPAAAIPHLVAHALQVAPGGRTSCVATCRIPQRGAQVFGPVWLRLFGQYGLLEGQQSFECSGVVKVFPETFASRDELEKDWGAELRLLDMAVKTRYQGVGTEFESLGPYRYGDDPRRIDWRATARSRKPVVRRHQIERHRDVMLLIDAGRLMGADAGRGSKLDCAVDAALMLARVVLRSGDRCGVGVFDRRVRGFLPPIAGATALQSLVQCVFDLKTEFHESDFTQILSALHARQAKRTFLIVLSDVSDQETSKQMCDALRQLGRRHLVLFAALRTPLLAKTVHEPLEDLLQASRKAVAFRLLRDRSRALFALKRSGVHVLDVEPEQLTTPLINQFIELRSRNLL